MQLHVHGIAMAEKKDDAGIKTKDHQPPGIERQEMDAVRLLQIGGGILCAIILLWFVLHSLLHII